MKAKHARMRREGKWEKKKGNQEVNYFWGEEG